MTKRKLSMCALGITMVLLCGLLSGCSLAREDAGEEVKRTTDRLVGVFLTQEHLDLFDMDAYLNDNIDKFVDGGTITVENSSKYEGRLYGTIDKHGYTQAKDCEHWEIRFGDLEGIAFFYSEWEEEGQEPFGMLMAGDEVCDVIEHLNVSDEGESVKLNGTIYMYAKENTESIGFYANPVYMTEAGEYYVVSGMGHYQGGIIGGSFTVKLEEEAEKTENGKKEVYGGGVELTISLMDSEPKEIRLFYMDKELNIMHTEVFAAGSMPKELHPMEGTTCIVVETEWLDGNVTRDLIEPTEGENATLETFYKISEITLGKMNTEIIWK